MKWSDALHDIVKTMMELVANNINYNVFVGVSKSSNFVRLISGIHKNMP